MVYGSWWDSLLHHARHLFNRNSRRGSKKNIHAHCDLGNEFYWPWLDPTTDDELLQRVVRGRPQPADG